MDVNNICTPIYGYSNGYGLMSLMGTETPPEIKEVIIVGRTVAVIVVCDMGTTCGDIGDYFDDDKKSTIDIYILKDPIKLRVPAGKISLNKFIGLAGKSLKLIEVDPIEFKVIRETTLINKNMKAKS